MLRSALLRSSQLAKGVRPLVGEGVASCPAIACFFSGPWSVGRWLRIFLQNLAPASPSPCRCYHPFVQVSSHAPRLFPQLAGAQLACRSSTARPAAPSLRVTQLLPQPPRWRSRTGLRSFLRCVLCPVLGTHVVAWGGSKPGHSGPLSQIQNLSTIIRSEWHPSDQRVGALAGQWH